MNMSDKRNNATHSVEELLGSRFEREPGLELGASDSAHETRIGTYGNIRVAAKPFFGKDAEYSARAEFSLTQEVAEKGFVTPRPFKVVPHHRHDAAIYMSHYMPGITGINSLRINDDLESKRGKILIANLGDLAILLGNLHDSGVVHGDAQIKNFGILQAPVDTFAQGSLVTYDLEKANIYDTQKPTTAAFKRDAAEDLGKVAYSLGYRYFGGYDPYAATDALHEAVFAPYLELSPAEQRLGGDAVGSALEHAEVQFLKARKQAHQNDQVQPKTAA